MKNKLSKFKGLFNAIIFFFVLTIISFLIIQLVPGDPVRALLGDNAAVLSEQELDEVRAEYGLNDPVVVQYVRWLGNVFKGDLGVSITSG